MKKLLLIVLAAATFGDASAQSDKYTAAMAARVQALDTTRDVQALNDLSNSFERIAEAEKTQWLPYYYAALAKVNAGYMLTAGKMGGMAATLDPVADKAEALLAKAESLTTANSELFVVKKMVATLRMMADPMSRYMTEGKAATEALESAKKLDPENPRVYYLAGQDKYYTPEQFGGSKAEAKALFELALQKFDSAKPADALAPRWGRGNTEYYLKLASK
ncbi:hypothetical protein [Flaviaesturariibacter amylovorans]|uniref:Tetratricopeptide repeat protein n=1 Tax=Flaviaesturariibacter amylovorans TaxID=1084520 RepID=A0ABP8G5F8_9BACT